MTRYNCPNCGSIEWEWFWSCEGENGKCSKCDDKAAVVSDRIVINVPHSITESEAERILDEVTKQ